MVRPSTSTGFAKEAEKLCPGWLPLELKVSPRRTVSTVPVGTTSRGAGSEALVPLVLPELIAPAELSAALPLAVLLSLAVEGLFASVAGGLLVQAMVVKAT